VRIARATVIVTSPGRNFVTLKLTTEDGATGLGDATVNGRELAVAGYLRDHVCPLLIGMDAHRIEHIWHYLYRGAYWRRGPITMAAIAAVDTALWDLKGKVAGLPVYQLLGGASRDGITVYGHANGATVAEVIDQVAGYVDHGYQAVRVQCAVPGEAGTYGVAKAPGPYEPADGRDRPTETVWSTEKYLDFVPGMIAAVRDRFGPELRLLHDVHHRLTPIEAARLGKSLEPVALYWLEDPTPAELQDSFRLIRRHTTTPIAVGEVFNTLWDCEQLIREQLVDFIRASVVHAGGITHLRRIFSYAELYQVRTASHGATDLSPVCMSAALHLDLAVPNFGLQEYMPHTPETDAVFPHGYHFADGYLHPSEEPGLGVEIDEELAARYPYDPAYLPVALLADGTIHHW
jgi:mannonate dehydratase